MKTKSYFFIFLFLVFLVSIPMILGAEETQTKSNFFNKIFSSFTGNVVDEGNGIERNGNFITGYKYKDYSEEDRSVVIDDGKGKVFAKVKLVSPQNNKVPAGEDVMVAEFLFEDFDMSSTSNVMTDMNFYDLNNNMNNINKNFNLKYLNGKGNESSWIEFSKFNELPSQNIQVGLFTDTSFGQKVEWIPEMFNFKISEWASYEVIDYPTQKVISAISSTYRDFDIENVSNEYTIITYSNSVHDGNAMMNRVYSNGTIQNGTNYTFESVYGYTQKLEPLGSDYFLNIYLCKTTIYDTYDSLCGVVLRAYTNNMTVASVGTRTILRTAIAADFSSNHDLKRLDTNLFVYAYSNSTDYKGYSYVVNAYTNGTVALSSANYAWESGSATNMPIAVEKIDTTHALISYGNTTDYSTYHGSAVVISAYSNGTMVKLSSVKYHDYLTAGKSIKQYNSSAFVQVYSAYDNPTGYYRLYQNILIVTPSTYAISNSTSTALDSTTYSSNPSLQAIDSDSFLVSYFYNNLNTNISYIAFDVSSSLSVTISNVGVFTLKYPSTTNILTKLNNSYFVNSWSNSTNSIYSFLIFHNETTDMGENFTSGSYSAYASWNSLLKMNNTRFLLAYNPASIFGFGNGYARTIDLNSSYGLTFGGIVSYTAQYASFNTRLDEINDTHYIVVFTDYYKVLRASILSVLSNGTVLAVSQDTSLRAATTYMGDIYSIDENHFLIAYRSGTTEYARVITAYANGTIVGLLSEVSFDAAGNGYPALEQIDSNHFLSIYGGTDDDGYAQILTAYANGTIVAGTAFEFKDATTVYYGDLAQIDSTHYLAMVTNTAHLLGVYTNNWTVYNIGTALTYFNGTAQAVGFALEKMNNNQYFAMYGGYYGAYTGDYRGYTSVIAVDSDTWTMSSGDPNLFSLSGGEYEDVEKIDALHYLGVYSAGDSGYAKVFSFLGGLLNTCECAGLNQNWLINLADYCIITLDCDLGVGLLSFSGAGNATFNATIKTANMTAPGSGGTLYIANNGLLNITSHGG